MSQPYPSIRPRLTESFFRLAGVVQGLLALSCLGQIALLAANIYYLRFADRLINTPQKVPMGDLVRFDRVSLLISLSNLVLLLLTGLAFIMWLFRAHRSDRMNPLALQHKSYWAVLGWFIPIMGLFRPYQMVSDVRRGADLLAITPAFQPYWWAAFLIGAIGDQIVLGLSPTGEEPGLRAFGQSLQSAARVDLGIGLVHLVGAILAILLVREITAKLRNAPENG